MCIKAASGRPSGFEEEMQTITFLFVSKCIKVFFNWPAVCVTQVLPVDNGHISGLKSTASVHNAGRQTFFPGPLIGGEKVTVKLGFRA